MLDQNILDIIESLPREKSYQIGYTNKDHLTLIDTKESYPMGYYSTELSKSRDDYYNNLSACWYTLCFDTLLEFEDAIYLGLCRSIPVLLDENQPNPHKFAFITANPFNKLSAFDYTSAIDRNYQIAKNLIC